MAQLQKFLTSELFVRGFKRRTDLAEQTTKRVGLSVGGQCQTRALLECFAYHSSLQNNYALLVHYVNVALEIIRPTFKPPAGLGIFGMNLNLGQ